MIRNQKYSLVSQTTQIYWDVTQMAKLKINELETTGVELFEDSETFLNALSDDELAKAMGGLDVVQIETYVATIRLTVVNEPILTYGCTIGIPVNPYTPVIL